MDCGPTCIRIIAKYYGKNISAKRARQLANSTRLGSTLLNLSEAAEKLGFRTVSVRCNFESLKKEAHLPCIVHWSKTHFVIVYRITNDRVFVSDPARTLVEYSTKEFVEQWIGNNATIETKEGIVLLLDTTPLFDALEEDENTPGLARGYEFLSAYLWKYKKFFIQLLVALGAQSLLSLIFPFLTQSVVDVGIQNQDINFIYLVLFSQLFLTLGQTVIEMVRGWVLLHLGTRINISLASDFFIKLMKLPMSFFDIKMTGDIIQRMHDNARIESFLTASTLSTIFSLFNGAIFAVLLVVYSPKIFLIFTISIICYFVWISLFMKKRAKLDTQRFGIMSKEQSKVIELISGMQDIKLHNAEREKRWGWEYIQASLYKLKIRSLKLEQTQSVGSTLINHIKDILISIFAAKAVIDGEITLGTMLAISYMVGQINAPISNFISFLISAQNAKLSLERLIEIHDKEEEEGKENFDSTTEFSENDDIRLNGVGFQYAGSQELVLKNLNLVIPANKITAIVGPSGGGKTTLVRLLMKYYDPSGGEIRIGNTDLKNIAPSAWRRAIGVVMQESFIFNDTIACNIAVKDPEHIDKDRLRLASEVANIQEFISTLPMRFNTHIGSEGTGLSTGQKQRIFIARAVYKDPKILIFDEPTSSLDANNEHQIMQNLIRFFKDKTVIIVAHRLSTVKNADQIVVVEKGGVSEVGNHEALVQKRGAYYNLVRNQLTLDN